MENTTQNNTGVSLHCGWGRLIFAHTFANPEAVGKAILQENPGERDIAFYLNDPHIVLNYAPQSLFLDPSHTFRLDFEDYRPHEKPPSGFEITPLQSPSDLEEINRIYSTLNMVSVEADYVWHNRDSDKFHYIVARNSQDGQILGVAMGVDHMMNFADLLNGCSLWSLAVDPQAELPKIGEWLVRHLVEYYQARNRAVMDLSVVHNNEHAIRLYHKLGFKRVAVFAVKRRNSINEKLFIPTSPADGFNPYAKIIIEEALRRGIDVIPIDTKRGYFRLRLGGKEVVCRESLTDHTSAIALSRCDDKELSKELFAEAGLTVASQIIVSETSNLEDFIKKHPRVVVKPARGEQGRGISVDLSEITEIRQAIDEAKFECDVVLIEEYIEGMDLRVIVIHNEVVAAALRKPPEIIGTGNSTIRDLINHLSRRRKAATGGESSIPMDNETTRCVLSSGYSLDDILPDGEKIKVRKTANLHTGGTIHDVTKQLHPAIAEAAITAAAVLDIPVTGLDFIVQRADAPDYVLIEANERPGLANHDPQPTAEKFMDFLFPQTIARK